MGIKILSASGSFDVAAGPTRDIIEMKSPSLRILRAVLGPECTIKQAGRVYRARVPKEYLGTLMLRLVDV